MRRHHDPHERRGGATGCLIGATRAFTTCALTISLLGLLGMGGILALSYLSNPVIQAVSDTLEHLNLASTAEDLSLPALWERLAVPVYMCASIAALSLVTLCVVRRPKPRHHTLMEGTA